MTAIPPKPIYRFIGTEPPAALAHLRNEPRWVAWEYTLRGNKWQKPPIDPKTGRHAKSDDPSTWGTFDDALRLVKRRQDLAGVGIVLDDELGFCGADLDDCITDSGSFSSLAAELVELAETYAEISPSGEGLRIFIKGKAKQALKLPHVEVYNDGRYLTVTGYHVGGTPLEVRQAPLTLARIETERPKRARPNGHAAPQGTDVGRIRSAVAVIPSDDRDVWLRMGMAIKSELGDAGFGIWREWSMTSAKWDEDDARRTWRSIEPGGGITIASLFDAAIKNGWRDEAKPRRARTAAASTKSAEPSWRDTGFTAADLKNATFPSVSYVVPGLIPEGLTLLAGKPKIGKSWMALDLGLGIAGSGFVLGGIRVETGNVLYAALEDNERRLQKRIRKLMADQPWPERLRLHTSWRRLDAGGIEDLGEWFDSAAAPRLVILDTLAGVRPVRTKDGGYSEDYDALASLHRFANDRAVGVLVLHHTRKADAEDPIDQVSGTLGLAGCADSILVLNRSQEKGVTLYGRGRDIEEFERAAEFSKEACQWRIKGNAEDVKRAETQERVLAFLADAQEPSMPKDVIAGTGLKDAAVGTALWRLTKEGSVVKEGRGKYRLAIHSGNPSTPSIRGLNE